MNRILRNKYFVFAIAVLVTILAAFIIFFTGSKQEDQKKEEPTLTTESRTTVPPVTTPKKIIFLPLESAKERITKKPFGIYITPQTSPVQPEKFIGYHTGTDFETTPAEASADVMVSTICSGKIRVRQIVSGYGGVIVQDCTIEGQTVVVLYGHINITGSSVPPVGVEAKGGDKIGLLAPANSEYSGGERKHLHLGIHKGSTVEYHGYVQSQSELSGWLSVESYL